jgi:hypothetical protein
MAERTSCSTSPTRRRLLLTCSNLTRARSLRFLYAPSPAASSTSARRVSGVEFSTSSTFPWPMTLCISRPSPTREISSCTSTRRQGEPFRRYPASPSRVSLRVISTSRKSAGKDPQVLSNTRLTSATADGRCPSAPAKMTSCMLWPRMLVGLCSPRAQSTASVRLLLPLPLGPMMTATPGSKTSSVGRAKVLNPRSRMERRKAKLQPSLSASTPRRTSASRAAACSLALMLRPHPRPFTLRPTSASDVNTRSCGGPSAATRR